jgi:hypothetical protein
VIYEYRDQGQAIHATLYGFHHAGQILMAVTARLTDGGSEPDSAVESAIRTLRFEE